ncbi:MAG: hypothetical protein CMJ48_00330 [Planctomycetaceae bacterium]|nr:hypothetical protein [Planctomycetaceae bacterium]
MPLCTFDSLDDRQDVVLVDVTAHQPTAGHDVSQRMPAFVKPADQSFHEWGAFVVHVGSVLRFESQLRLIDCC